MGLRLLHTLVRFQLLLLVHWRLLQMMVLLAQPRSRRIYLLWTLVCHELLARHFDYSILVRTLARLQLLYLDHWRRLQMMVLLAQPRSRRIRYLWILVCHGLLESHFDCSSRVYTLVRFQLLLLGHWRHPQMMVLLAQLRIRLMHRLWTQDIPVSVCQLELRLLHNLVRFQLPYLGHWRHLQMLVLLARLRIRLIRHLWSLLWRELLGRHFDCSSLVYTLVSFLLPYLGHWRRPQMLVLLVQLRIRLIHRL